MEKVIVLNDVDNLILHLLDDEALYVMGNSNKHVKTVILKDPRLKTRYITYRMRYTGLLNDMRRMAEDGKITVRVKIDLSNNEVKMIIPYATDVMVLDGTVIYKVRIDEVIKSLKALLLYVNGQFNIHKLSQYPKQSYMIYYI